MKDRPFSHVEKRRVLYWVNSWRMEPSLYTHQRLWGMWQNSIDGMDSETTRVYRAAFYIVKLSYDE